MTTRHRVISCALVIVLTAMTIRAAEEDPRIRAQAALQSGLKWLAECQVTEGPEAGSWETSEPRYRAAITSFAGLAFLANGHLPGRGEYGVVIQRAMDYVRNSMAPDGYLGQGDQSGMYIHAICTLFGLSYLGMSSEPVSDLELADWCRKSLRVILEAQKVSRAAYAQGGWRYTPHTEESDVSVTSWQLLVLHAARQCGYAIEDDAIDAALRFVNGAFIEQPETPSGPRAGFVYRPSVSQDPEPAATGAAVFIKSLFERHEDARVGKSLNFLATYPPSWGGEQYGGYFFFSAFYMTQGMFQIGEPVWGPFIDAMRGVLLEHQVGDGSWPYPADDMRQSQLAGPAYPTAMAVLILSLEKQYLPMYQRQKGLF
ncbi:MAG: terpene cyclase/mutase family protein [Lentisphaerae bacterium]|nr:terpene cyclase/mutase family protein [Lentisphaerota bacterium]